ncbi:MAG: hypothetical protein U5K31_00385 [Balneolaceae bacterium]|nr:hypothetical protein [Balneolaceae bacterium]
MPQNDKPQKLFKVASEFNVSTQSIVDALAEEGIEIANKPNSKITSDMYEVLEEEYGSDKEKSREHEKAREQYESRRNQIRQSRNETVSIDDFLQPQDEEEMPLEPQDGDDGTIAGLKPQVEESESPKVEESESQEVEKSEEVEESEVEESESPEVEESDEVEESEVEESESQKVEESESQEVEESDEVEKSEVEESDEVEESESQEVEESEEDEKEDDGIDEEMVIRGRAGKLKGTKVLGKVEIDEENKQIKRRKKRKRKKDLKDSDSDKSSSSKTKKRKNARAGADLPKTTSRRSSRRLCTRCSSPRLWAPAGRNAADSGVRSVKRRSRCRPNWKSSKSRSSRLPNLLP